ncbi:ATP-binding protein [Solitalea sp. MAHUQ-68]|uniref:histidine kinase n=1 Tax=Solitalea agri TaxID=2953739 RepID=A0A9X2F538_9SPHI|nr:ATP-binding protein [Solitalea agri]MCO4294290.1 ATP-binding protein [Solitalea agri]
MKLINKLRLGLGLLFFFMLLVYGLSAYYLRKLSKESELILKNNYETLEFSKNMMKILDLSGGMLTKEDAFNFEYNLKKQETNVTELGEGEFTKEIRTGFESLKKATGNETKASIKADVEKSLYAIMDLNMEAIVKKNSIASETARKAAIYVTLISSFFFLVAFSFIVNFPGYIANPISELTFKIKEIANKRYDQRLSFSRNDEFGDLAQAFNTMASKLNEYEHSNLAKILFEKSRIETIINSMQDAIIGFDENNTILFANPVALTLLGLKDQDVVGKYAPDVALRNDLLRNLLKAGNSEDLKIFAENKESYFSKETFQVTSETEGGEPKIIGQVISLKNITKFHELNEAKTNFIATISHELKTPISAIKMSLKLLEDNRVGIMNEEQKDLVNHIKEDTSRLLKITGELLDLSQVETGNIQLNFQTIKPVDIVNYALEAVQVPASLKGVTIDLKLEDKLPEVCADTEKTAWVLVNFLTNAIRYSPERSTVNLKLVRKNDAVEFSVKDLGKGIDAQYLEKIFDRYFQVPSDLNSKGGTGLGLAISKDFIQAQHGQIWAESEPGMGSTFHFTLPVMKIPKEGII